MARPLQIVFDAHDPARLAEFWAMALGYQLQPPPEGHDSWESWAVEMEIPEENWNDASALVDPDGVGPRVFIQKVPEDKTAKNRVHLDIGVGADLTPEDRPKAIDDAAGHLAAAGATIVGPREQFGTYWVVMQDPEGNEFCVH